MRLETELLNVNGNDYIYSRSRLWRAYYVLCPVLRSDQTTSPLILVITLGVEQLLSSPLHRQKTRHTGRWICHGRCASKDLQAGLLNFKAVLWIQQNPASHSLILIKIIWWMNISSIKNKAKGRAHVAVVQMRTVEDTERECLRGLAAGKYFLGHRKCEPPTNWYMSHSQNEKILYTEREGKWSASHSWGENSQEQSF